MPRLKTESDEFVSSIAFTELWSKLDQMIDLAITRLTAGGREIDAAELEAARTHGCKLMRTIAGVVGSNRFSNAAEFAHVFAEFRSAVYKLHGDTRMNVEVDE